MCANITEFLMGYLKARKKREVQRKYCSEKIAKENSDLDPVGPEVYSSGSANSHSSSNQRPVSSVRLQVLPGS